MWPALLLVAQNILVVVADDLGTDEVNVYEEGPRFTQPPTPNLDAFARAGVLFRNAWSHPACSPTRASLMTGLLPFRTGIGERISFTESTRMDPALTTLPEVLRQQGYAVAMVGKWHLGGDAAPFLEPMLHGVDLFVGTRQGVSTGYWHFDQRLVTPWSDRAFPPDEYSATELTDHALELLRILPEPWFLLLCHHLPHPPFHTPPLDLHGYGPCPDDRTKYMAMVEALDTEFGRLLAHVDRTDTTVFFLGDNGAPAEVATLPGRGKGTLYQGGIHVPLIVAGAGVGFVGRRCDALVGVTDLYATIAELAGATASTPDAVSFARALATPDFAGRTVVTAERFKPNGMGPKQVLQRAARDARYKLILDVLSGRPLFFDLGQDPQERAPLDLARLNQQERRSYRALRTVLDGYPPF